MSISGIVSGGYGDWGSPSLIVTGGLLSGAGGATLHVRTQIRRALSQLLSGATAAGSNVHDTRVRIVEASQLPAILIGLGPESAETLTVSAPEQLERGIEILITPVAAANDALDDVLDDLLKDIEATLNAQTDTGLLGGKLKLNVDFEIDEVEIDRDGKIPVGRLIMRRRAVYYTSADDPTTAQ